MSVYSTALLILASVATIQAVKWVNCPGTTPLGVVSKVAVGGCDTTPVCILIKGQNASFEIDFTIGEDTNTAKSVVHGIIDKIPFPFTPDNPDVCKDSGITCPIKNKSINSYKTQIYVKTGYPPVSVTVKWEIQDDNGKDIVCIELPAKISSGNNTPKSDSRLLFKSQKQL